MNGIRIRLETNPGKSLASAGVLPRSRANPGIGAPLLRQLGEAPPHRLEPLLGRTGRRIVKEHAPPGRGHDLRDSGTHLPRPDNQHVVELHHGEANLLSWPTPRSTGRGSGTR